MKIKKVLSILIVFALVLTASVASGQTDYVKINFQPAGADVPGGYEVDSGQVFGDQGNGFSYGWDEAVNETRDRGGNEDQRYDTLNHMQKTSGRYWELAVPDGVYDIFLVCGDASHTDQVNTLDIEGVIVTDPDGEDNFDEYELTDVAVSDGRLTIAPADGADNAKICFIEVSVGDPTFNPAPSVDAGPDISTYLNIQIQLAGVVTDAPPEEGDPGVLTYYWYLQNGPGNATFDPADTTDVADPMVTFDTKGVYELVLQATDGDKDANDVVLVTVKDRADEFIVGHWDFEGDAGDRSINSNDGTLMYGASIDSVAAVGTGSVNLIDTNIEDPNRPYVDLGPATELDFSTGSWTVSAWVKTTQIKGSGDEGKGAIFANGADSGGGHRYTLIASEGDSGTVTLVTDDDSNKRTIQTSNQELINDDMWHFIVGVRDGRDLRIYRDGILDASGNTPENYDLSGTSTWNSYIGAIVNNSDPNGALYKFLDGMVDDVRIYNYALPMEDEPEYDSISTLAALGPIVATIDAGPDADFAWKPGLELQLEGSITDFGMDNPMTVLWQTESGPDDAEATFISPSDPATMVTFPAAGTYVLKLTVIDEGVTLEDFVTITVTLPTCADVAADGLLLAVDFDGNCHVDLNDLAILADNWAKCNDPIDPECEWPF